jgi:hypothetical protein
MRYAGRTLKEAMSLEGGGQKFPFVISLDRMRHNQPFSSFLNSGPVHATTAGDPEQPFISRFRCSIADLNGNQR